MCSSPTRTPPWHKQPTPKVCSPKKTAKDGYIEVRRIQLLRTENVLVHKPFVQNADSAVIFMNPCPQICIKAGKFPLNLGSRYEFRWKLFVPDRYVFWGIWGLRLGLSGLHRQTHVKATMCRSPTQTPSFAQTDHAKGVLSKRKTGEDGYVEAW